MPIAGRIRSRWGLYVALSTTLAGGVIVKSMAQRPNFYSAAVYLSQSSANLMVLANLVLVTACTAILSLQRTLYGPLRPSEIELLYEKAWFAVTETCLAMTIFRGEIGAWFLVMFFSLLLSKVWGWIGEGRVEMLEQQPPRNPRLFHTRLALSLGLSVVFNVSMLEYIVNQVLHMARPDMMVMFAFEFAVLCVISLTTATRYSLNLIEIGIVRGQKLQRAEQIRKERIDTAVRDAAPSSETVSDATNQTSTATTAYTPAQTQAAQEAAAQQIDIESIEVEGWEAKGRLVFYLDLASDFLKLGLYIAFFFILLIFYGLPLHIMRDVFLTARSFVKRIGDFLRYRTATRDMNNRYPDATEAEINRVDVCIICREDMRPYVAPAQGQPRDPMAERMRPKKLPCGHVLHLACLRSWLERQQICPTCRASVVPTTPNASTTVAAPANRAQVGQAPQARVYRFGPLRLGVGAARGNDMIGQMREQMANMGRVNGPRDRQFGFGLQWGGRNRRDGRDTARGSVQEQLDGTERQIQRELDQLQASLGELQVLRSIQAQLARLRMARQQPQQPQQPEEQRNANQSLPSLRQTGMTMTSLTQDSSQNVLQAGSDQLPEGLTLPEGWSLMPLQAAPQRPIAGPFVGQMPTMPPFPGFPIPDGTNVQTTVIQGFMPMPMSDQTHTTAPSTTQQGQQAQQAEINHVQLSTQPSNVSESAANIPANNSQDTTQCLDPPSAVQTSPPSASRDAEASWAFPTSEENEDEEDEEEDSENEQPSTDSGLSRPQAMASLRPQSDKHAHVSDEEEDSDEDSDE